MKNGLYHYEVYWNEIIQKQINDALNAQLPLNYSQHTIKNTFDRSISIKDISLDKLKRGEHFEAEVLNDKVVKFAIRYAYDESYDLCSVWIPRNDCLFCKTIWLNAREDKHYTLNEKNYVSYDNNNSVQHISISLGDLIHTQKNIK